jgi:hypothetical protein
MIGDLYCSCITVFSEVMLLYLQDGESNEYPPPPNWRELLRAEGDRVGVVTYPKEE